MRRVFKTVEEAWEYANSAECEAEMLALPPEVDELTDEEEFDDGDLGMPVVTDIPGNIEVNINSDEEHPDKKSDTKEKDGDDEDTLPLASLITKNQASTSARSRPSSPFASSPSTSADCQLPAKKRRLAKPTFTADWERISPEYRFDPLQDTPSQKLHELKLVLQEATPVGIFEQFFDESVYNMIVEETLRYANQKNKHSFSISVDEIKIFLGFLIFSGYHTLPSERDYWSESEDLGIPLVRNAMSRNAYLEIKSLIHFQDNTKADQNKHDKSFKISPLIQMVNSNFSKWGVFQSNLSIDEMIVRYYGHHPLKQFIRAKPIRFGYKLWAMCGNDGYCFNFSLYCGKDQADISMDSLGTRVVTKMLAVVEDPKSCYVYFDNFFTSLTLLCRLKDLGFRATGTIRENRTQKCPLKSTKELEKNGRGSYDYQFDQKNKIFAVKWNDNKCVTLATNFDAIEPIALAPRWSKEKKERVALPQPRLIYNYNHYMGGVDQHDWLLEKHNISVRGKKWYWSLVTRIIDMAVVNAFLLYRKIHGKKSISIKEFRRSIAVEYLKIGHGKRVLKGRPLSFPSTSRSKVPDGVRYDERGHFLEKRGKQRRCQYANCSSKPITFCSKCNITLCTQCFPKYHRKP